MALSRYTLILIFITLFAIVFFHQDSSTLNIGGRKIHLELAKTLTEQERGLSGRTNLPPDRGMLFVYDTDVRPAFWMKDMLFPLDIIWLDKNYTVVGWEKNIAPATYPKTFRPKMPIRFVLEVMAGFVDKSALKVGDKAYN